MKARSPGRETVAEDPAQDWNVVEAVIDVEAVGHRAGMALWTREQLDQHRFLRID